MITTMTYFFFIIMNLSLIKVKSPVKMIMLLLMSSGSLLLNCANLTGEVWVATVLYLLIIGGIIVSLMILSSIHLNQKMTYNMMNLKLLGFVVMFYLLFFSIILSMGPNFQNVNKMFFCLKWGFEESNFPQVVTTILLIYFFSFLFMLMKNKFSMRKNLC